MKNTILIIIDNLGRGGAEVLLVGSLAELNKKFNVILVTLTSEIDFPAEDLQFHKKYTLGFTGKLSILPCIFRLKKIIRLHKPELVHAHLQNSSIIARAASPGKTPLLITLHNLMSLNVFNNSFLYRLIERIQKNKKHILIAVSDTVLKDYEKMMGLPEKTYVLHNYIDDAFISASSMAKKTDLQKGLKLVAVGNIKRTKNYIYLVQAFKNLKDYPLTLDIYGGGSEKDIESLQGEIDKDKLPIYIKGKSSNIDKQLSLYDAYVLCSLYEGFAIAAVEAMGKGLPLLLSDLEVLREVTLNNAIFFKVDNTQSFVQVIKDIFNNAYDLEQLSYEGINIAKKFYSKQNHITRLIEIYEDSIRH